MTERWALLAVSVVFAGCATTNGRDWLNSPLEQRATLNAEVVEGTPASVDARPRLSHTVTLGESYTSEATPVAASAPTVQVNVHTQVPIVINNFGGYGYGGYGYGPGPTFRATPARTSSAASTKVGGDFPAPPDYGPRALR